MNFSPRLMAREGSVLVMSETRHLCELYVQRAQEAIFSLRDSVRNVVVNMIPFAMRIHDSVVFGGESFDLTNEEDCEAFLEAFNSRILFTYRKHMEPIAPDPARSVTMQATSASSDDWCARHEDCALNPNENDYEVGASSLLSRFRPMSSLFSFGRNRREPSSLIVSDDGWGCMIRVGQMALAQCFVYSVLGSNWKRKATKDCKSSDFLELTRSSRLPSRAGSVKASSGLLVSEDGLLCYQSCESAPFGECEAPPQRGERVGRQSESNFFSPACAAGIDDVTETTDHKEWLTVKLEEQQSLSDGEYERGFCHLDLLETDEVFEADAVSSDVDDQMHNVWRLAGSTATLHSGDSDQTDDESVQIDQAERCRQIMNSTPHTIIRGVARFTKRQRRRVAYRSVNRRWSFEVGPKRSHTRSDRGTHEKLLSILNLFMDTPSSPFSLHNIVEYGRQRLGKAPSSWFGPTSCAAGLGALMDRSPARCFGLRPVVFPDAPIYMDTVKNVMRQAGPEPCRGVLIFLSLKLGLARFNHAEYKRPLQKLFKIRQFQGLAGGGPTTSAYFFVGANDKDLFYLDPHCKVQKGFTTNLNNASADLLEQFFPEEPRQLAWESLNPSMTLVFVCRCSDGESEDLEDLRERLSELDCDLLTPQQTAPDYSRLDDVTIWGLSHNCDANSTNGDDAYSSGDGGDDGGTFSRDGNDSIVEVSSTRAKLDDVELSSSSATSPGLGDSTLRSS